MCEHFLIARAEVAHLLVMHGSDVAMEVGPSPYSHIASRLWAVVMQEICRVSHDLWGLVFDTNVVISADKISIREVFISFRGIISEDNIL